MRSYPRALAGRSLLAAAGVNLRRGEQKAAETIDRAIQWLEQERERPFFAWVHLFDPHLPYNPPTDLAERFAGGYDVPADGRWYRLGTRAKEPIATSPEALGYLDRLYDAEIASVDRQVERLFEVLRDSGLDENTIIVFTADHGESHGEHGHYFERDLHRVSLHVPLIIRPPPGLLDPARVATSVGLIDVAPTILELVGVSSPSPMAGRSLVPAARGEPFTGTSVFSLFPHHGRPEIVNGMYSLQEGDWKLMSSTAWWYSNGIRVAPEEQLYAVASDPLELDDLVESQPAELTGLRDRLGAWSEIPPPESAFMDEATRRMLEGLGYVQE